MKYLTYSSIVSACVDDMSLLSVFERGIEEESVDGLSNDLIVL